MLAASCRRLCGELGEDEDNDGERCNGHARTRQERNASGRTVPDSSAICFMEFNSLISRLKRMCQRGCVIGSRLPPC